MARADQGDIAWSHVLDQHRASQTAEGFFRAFYAPLTGLANAFDDLTLALTLDQAEGERLDLIGSIVGIGRTLPAGITLLYFGFASQASGRGFGQARMRREREPISTTYIAPDAEFRPMIRAKIRLNNARGTAPEIEQASREAFRWPTVSVRDAGPAHFEIWIGREPEVGEVASATLSPLLPRAAGVGMSIGRQTILIPFGFRENNHLGFGLGFMARAPSA
jgi:hypothetical protein